MRELSLTDLTSSPVRARPLLILFWVEGCSLCEQAKKSLTAISALNLEVDFATFKVDLSNQEIVNLINKYGMKNPPSLLVLNNNKPYSLLEQVTDFNNINLFVRYSLAGLTSGKRLSFLNKVKSLVKVVYNSIKLKINKNQILANSELINQRNIICNNCPSKINGKCSLCGCKLSVKIAFKAANCPKNLW